MPLARVVTFEGVPKERMDAMASEIQAQGRPEGLPATEIIGLHDREAERAYVIVFFADEEDYARGDEFLNAMPADETPGTRSSVTRCEVSVRMTA